MYIRQGQGFWSSLFMQFVRAYSHTQFSLRQCMGGCVYGLIGVLPYMGYTGMCGSKGYSL